MWYKRMELEIWFDKYQYEIDYDVGESAVKTLPLRAVPAELKDISLRYGYHRGRPELRRIIAEQYPGLNEDNILVTTGASEANFAVVSALANPGEHVIIEHPNYPSLYEVPRSLGCDVSLFTLRYENRFRPDLDELEKLVRPDTKLISITHPNNPTGSMISREDLENIIALAENHGIPLLSDETYQLLAPKAKRLPPAAVLSENAISITSMSKCYGLPGIRTGWIASQDRDLIDQCVAIREQVSISNNALSEVIAAKVLEDKAIYLQKAYQRIKTNLALLKEWMERQSDIEWIPPEAGVVCFPKIKENISIDPEEVYRLAAEKYRTFVVPGRCFEMSSRHFRIGFGADADELSGGLARLEKAMGDIKVS